MPSVEETVGADGFGGDNNPLSFDPDHFPVRGSTPDGDDGGRREWFRSSRTVTEMMLGADDAPDADDDADADAWDWEDWDGWDKLAAEDERYEEVAQQLASLRRYMGAQRLREALSGVPENLHQVAINHWAAELQRHEEDQAMQAAQQAYLEQSREQAEREEARAEAVARVDEFFEGEDIDPQQGLRRAATIFGAWTEDGYEPSTELAEAALDAAADEIVGRDTQRDWLEAERQAVRESWRRPKAYNHSHGRVTDLMRQARGLPGVVEREEALRALASERARAQARDRQGRFRKNERISDRIFGGARR
jgi:hypothetical protein